MKFSIKTFAGVFVVAVLALSCVTRPTLAFDADVASFLESKGVIASAADFDPDQAVNRAEFLKMAIMATQKQENVSGSHCFDDVQDEWFAPFVCMAKKEMIVAGFGYGNFRPNGTVTFIEMIKIVVGAFGFDTWGEPVWNTPFLTEAEAPRTMLDFHRDMKKGEVAMMIFRLMQTF